jgi:ACR3 family arsenite transporter
VSSDMRRPRKGLSGFEKYLTLWVALCIAAGILLGKVAPGVARFLDSLAIPSRTNPVVSIPIAVCLFFMMYPMMVKFDAVRQLGHQALHDVRHRDLLPRRAVHRFHRN